MLISATSFEMEKLPISILSDPRHGFLLDLAQFNVRAMLQLKPSIFNLYLIDIFQHFSPCNTFGMQFLKPTEDSESHALCLSLPAEKCGFDLLAVKPIACERNGVECAAMGFIVNCSERLLRAVQKSLSSNIDLGCWKYSCSRFSFSISQLPFSSLRTSLALPRK